VGQYEPHFPPCPAPTFDAVQEQCVLEGDKLSRSFFQKCLTQLHVYITSSHLHLWTVLFCIYRLCYYCCCCTVCTALLRSYSAIFIAYITCLHHLLPSALMDCVILHLRTVLLLLWLHCLHCTVTQLFGYLHSKIPCQFNKWLQHDHLRKCHQAQETIVLLCRAWR